MVPDPERHPERAAIARWLSQLPGRAPWVRHAAGEDDVAWIDTPAALAVSTDTVVEDVHFRRSWGARAAGRRAMAAALSDLAAARARPVGATLSITAPAGDLRDRRWLDEAVAGIGDVADAHGCPILGGDTTSGPVVVLGVTVLGAGGPPLLRSGARPGELLQCSGPTGWSALAVQLLEAGEALPAEARRAWESPRPRLDVLAALGPATAGIDVSDGLLLDASRLAERSGVRLLVDPGAAVAPALRAAAPDDAELLALTGGEDWELLVTAPLPLPGFLVIGRVEAGADVALLDGRPLPPRLGWDHGGGPR